LQQTQQSTDRDHAANGRRSGLTEFAEFRDNPPSNMITPTDNATNNRTRPADSSHRQPRQKRMPAARTGRAHPDTSKTEIWGNQYAHATTGPVTPIARASTR